MNTYEDFSSTLKAKVGLALLHREISLAEISDAYAVPISLLHEWLDQAIANLPLLVSSSQANHSERVQYEALLKRLTKEAARLKAQVEWLKERKAHLRMVTRADGGTTVSPLMR